MVLLRTMCSLTSLGRMMCNFLCEFPISYSFTNAHLNACLQNATRRMKAIFAPFKKQNTGVGKNSGKNFSPNKLSTTSLLALWGCCSPRLHSRQLRKCIVSKLVEPKVLNGHFLRIETFPPKGSGKAAETRGQQPHMSRKLKLMRFILTPWSYRSGKPFLENREEASLSGRTSAT